MADKLELNGEIASAVGFAAVAWPLGGRAGYVNEDGDPSGLVSRQHACGWGGRQIRVRKAGEGFSGGDARLIRRCRSCITRLAKALDPSICPFAGRAHVEPSANDEVYSAIVEGERQQDPDRKGVAAVVDVDSVNGFQRGRALRGTRNLLKVSAPPRGRAGKVPLWTPTLPRPHRGSRSRIARARRGDRETRRPALRLRPPPVPRRRSDHRVAGSGCSRPRARWARGPHADRRAVSRSRRASVPGSRCGG